MTSQYRCETCKNENCIYFYESEDSSSTSTPGRLGKWYHKLSPAMFTREMGCASHSDFNPQAERKNAITELINFDRWFSSHHVCGKYALVGETRQWVHSRIKELRQKDDEP